MLIYTYLADVLLHSGTHHYLAPYIEVQSCNLRRLSFQDFSAALDSIKPAAVDQTKLAS